MSPEGGLHVFRPFVPKVPMKEAPAKQTIILVVEDDADQRAILRHELERARYSVLEAASGEEALTVLRDRQGLIDWLYADIRLPGAVDGWRVADEFRFAHPLRPVIYGSGYPSDRRRCVPGSLFFAKPFMPSDLVKAFEELNRQPVEEPVMFWLGSRPALSRG